MLIHPIISDLMHYDLSISWHLYHISCEDHSHRRNGVPGRIWQPIPSGQQRTLGCPHCTLLPHHGGLPPLPSAIASHCWVLSAAHALGGFPPLSCFSMSGSTPTYSSSTPDPYLNSSGPCLRYHDQCLPYWDARPVDLYFLGHMDGPRSHHLPMLWPTPLTGRGRSHRTFRSPQG